MEKHIRIYILFGISLFFLLAARFVSAAQINKTINFQSKVVNSDGTNVADGTYDFVFTIYDGPGSGGVSLFTESWTAASLFQTSLSGATVTTTADGTVTFGGGLANCSSLKKGQLLTNITKGESTVIIDAASACSGSITVAQTPSTWAAGNTVTNKIYVKNGIFQVAINSLNQNMTADFNQDSLFLGINFNSDGEAKPRIQLAAAPYALNADKVNGLTVTNTTGTLTIPDGKTIAFSGANNLTFTTTGDTTATLPSGSINLVGDSSSQTLTNKTIGTTGLTFEGAATDITTGTDENLTIAPNGAGIAQFLTDVEFYRAATISGSLAIGGADASNGVLTVSAGTGKAQLVFGENDTWSDTYGATIRVTGGLDANMLRLRPDSGVVAIIPAAGVNGELHIFNDQDNQEPFRFSGNGISWLNGGNVGIGTTTADEKLTLNGKLLLQEAGNTGKATLEALSYGFESGWLRVVAGGTGGTVMEVRDIYDWSFIVGQTNGLSKFKNNLSIGGNVGIGTTDAVNNALDVIGNATVSGNLMAGGQLQVGRFGAEPAGLGNGSMYYNTSNNTFRCFVNGSWANCAGGTGSPVWSSIQAPSENLSLAMAANTTSFNWATGTGTNDLFSLTTDASANGTGALLNIQTGASSTVAPLRVRAGSTEALSVNSLGYVGVGTASAGFPLAVHDVTGTGGTLLKLDTASDGLTGGYLELTAGSRTVRFGADSWIGPHFGSTTKAGFMFLDNNSIGPMIALNPTNDQVDLGSDLYRYRDLYSTGIDTQAITTQTVDASQSMYVGATRTIEIVGDYAGIGELGAGGLIASRTIDNLSLVASSVNGDSAGKVIIGYNNGTSWYSGLELANVTGGGTTRGNLLLMKSGGNVGIGTTNPLETLDVWGNATISGSFTIGNSSALQSAYGPLTFNYKSDLNSWLPALSIQDTTGFVGIGTVNPASALQVAGNITSKGTGDLSEKFGYGAAADGIYSIAFGNIASALGANAISIGYNSSANIGSVAVGGNTSTGNNSVVIGTNSQVGHQGVAIGGDNNVNDVSIALGLDADTTGSNQFVVGSGSYPVYDFYFGKGVENAAPSGVTIHGTGGTGSAAGGSLSLTGGTGSAVGDVLLQAGGGNVGIGTTSPNSKLDVRGGTISTGESLTPADLGWTLGAGENANIFNGGSSGANSYGDLVMANSSSSPAAGNYMGDFLFAAKSTGNLDTYTGLKAMVTAQLEGSGGSSAGLGANLQFWTRKDNAALSERMRIDNNGNVGIGTTDPGWGKLSVNGGGSGAKTLIARGNSSDDANIQEWQNNAGTALTTINQHGFIDLTGANGDAAYFNTILKFNSSHLGDSELSGGFDNGVLKQTGTGRILFNYITDDSANSIFSGGVNGEGYRRFALSGGGNWQLGPGTATQDTFMQRLSGGGMAFSTSQTGAPIVTVSGTSGQTAHYLDITSSGGSAGNILLVDSAGNVGVGTTSTTGKLDIYRPGGPQVWIRGDGGGSGSSASFGVNGDPVGGGSSLIGLYASDALKLAMTQDSGVSDPMLSSFGSSPLIFGVSGSEVARFDTSGNLGIGSTSPGAKIDVTGSATISGNLMIGGQMQVGRFGAEPTGIGNGSMYYNTTTNKFRCFVNGSWADCSGGTGSPVWSSIQSPSGNLSLGMTTYTTAFNWATGTSTNNLFSLTTDASANGTGYLFNIATGTSSTVKPFRVAAGTTEALMVDAAGNVGIGTTDASGANLTVNAANPSLLLYDTSALKSLTLSSNTSVASLTYGSTTLIETDDNSYLQFNAPVSSDISFNTALNSFGINNMGGVIIAPHALPGAPSTGTVIIDSGNSNKLKWWDGSSWKEAGGTGVQTPWAQDIAAAGYDLTGLSNLLFQETTAAPAGTDVGFYRDNSGDLTGNVLTGKTFHLAVNGADEYNFSSSSFDVGNNTITNVGDITGFGSNQTISSGFGATMTVKSGEGSVSHSGDLYLLTGNADAIAVDSGSIMIDTGTATNLTGTIEIGKNNASAINFGSLNTYINTTVSSRFVITPRALPGGVSTGELVIDSSDSNKLKWWNGSGWQTAGGTGSSAWSGIQVPTADLTLAMSTYKTTFNWATGTGANSLFNLTTDASSNGTGYLFNVATGTSSTVKPLRIAAAGVEAIMVNALGNVGIGTTAPTAKLDIAGNASFSGNLAIEVPSGANAATIFDAYNGATLNFRTSPGGDDGAVSRLFIANSGDISMGTTTPVSLLHVNGSTPKITLSNPTNTPGSNTLLGQLTSRTNYYSADLAGIKFEGDGSFTGGTYPSRMTFFTTPNGAYTVPLERMRIDAAGNVGIGTTTTTNAKLELDSGSAGTSGLRFTRLTSASTPGASSGNVLTVDANGNIVLVNDQTGSGTVPSGSANGDTLRWNGSSWVANNVIYNNGTNVGIGSTSPTQKLDVSGNATVSGDITMGGQLRVGRFGTDPPASANGAMYYNTTTNKFRCYQNGVWTNCVNGDRVFTVKSADENVASGTTLQNDDALSFAVGSGETWIFDFALNVTNLSSATPDWKAAILGASGWTCNVTMWGSEPGATGFPQATTTDCDNAPTAVVNGTIASDGGIPFEVRIQGAITTNSAGTVYLQWAPNTSGSLTVLAGSYVIAQKVNGADLAEAYYAKDLTIEPGNLVSLEPGTNAGVKKSTAPYDKNVLGVISTKPGLIMGDVVGGEGKQVLVALSGRIPVKVSTESGIIRTGDYLTSSSMPGVAMKAVKAGYTIGQALEDDTGTGTVLAFIKNSFYTGSYGAAGLTGTEILSRLMDGTATVSAQPADISELYADRVVAGMEIVAPLVRANAIDASTLTISNETDGPTVLIDNRGNASFSGTLTADIIRANRIEGMELISDSISDMKMADANREASISATRQDIASLANRVNTLEGQAKMATASPDLHITGNSVFDGVITALNRFVTQNLVVMKVAEFFDKTIFHKETVFEGKTMFNSDTGGAVVIKKDTQTVDVRFDHEFDTPPLITISFTGDTSANVQEVLADNYMYIIINRTTKGFTIVLNKKAERDVSLTWIALQVQDARTTYSDAPTPIPLTPVPNTPIPLTPTVVPTGELSVTPVPTLTEPTPVASAEAVVQ